MKLTTILAVSGFAAAALLLSVALLQPWKHGKTNVPGQDNPDYDTAFILKRPDAIVVFQNGNFNCPKGQHRAFMILADLQGVMVGCGNAGKDGVFVDWEDGGRLEIHANQLNMQPEQGLPPGHPPVPEAPQAN